MGDTENRALDVLYDVPSPAEIGLAFSSDQQREAICWLQGLQLPGSCEDYHKRCLKGGIVYTMRPKFKNWLRFVVFCNLKQVI